MLTLSLRVLKVLITTIIQEKEMKVIKIRKKEVKLLADDMMLYTETLKSPPKKKKKKNYYFVIPKAITL